MQTNAIALRHSRTVLRIAAPMHLLASRASCRSSRASSCGPAPTRACRRSLTSGIDAELDGRSLESSTPSSGDGEGTARRQPAFILRLDFSPCGFGSRELESGPTLMAGYPFPSRLDDGACSRRCLARPGDAIPRGAGARVVATVTTLEGTVHMAGMLVELRQADGTVLAKTVTDNAGQVTFPDLPPGRYTIKSIRPGFRTPSPRLSRFAPARPRRSSSTRS